MFLLIRGVLYSIDKSQVNTVIMQPICQLFEILFKMNYLLRNARESPSEMFQTDFNEMILNNYLIE